jgi:hypothetical protein
MGKVSFVGNISTFLCLSYNLLDTQVYSFTVMFLGHTSRCSSPEKRIHKDIAFCYGQPFFTLFLSCCSFELKLLLLYLCISRIFYS